MAETCQRRLCDLDVLENALIEVETNGVTREWCPQCVADEFGEEALDRNELTKSVLRYVTPATVASFLSGALLMLIVASVVVV